MNAVRGTLLRTQLLERRERLESAIAEFEEPTHLVHLLQEVDTALQQMDTGSYGLCEVCHDPIEEDRLTADPLLRNCLDHLTPGQRRALEQDLDLASQIQNGLLPKQSLSFAGWRFTITLYTDGLSEARDGSDAEYGVERLSKLAGGCRGLSPRAL